MDGKDTVIVISDDSDSEEISTLVAPPINVSTNKLGQGVAPPNNLHGSSSLATSATHGSLIPPVIPAVVASNTPSTPSLVKKSKTSSTTTRVVNHQIDSRNQGKQPFINHSTSFKPVVGPRDNAIDMHNAQEAASVAASVRDLPSIVQGKSWDSISVRTLARYTLQKVFGFPYFRGFQELIIQAALAPGRLHQLKFRVCHLFSLFPLFLPLISCYLLYFTLFSLLPSCRRTRYLRNDAHGGWKVLVLCTPCPPPAWSHGSRFAAAQSHPRPGGSACARKSL